MSLSKTINIVIKCTESVKSKNISAKDDNYKCLHSLARDGSLQQSPMIMTHAVGRNQK